MQVSRNLEPDDGPASLSKAKDSKRRPLTISSAARAVRAALTLDPNRPIFLSLVTVVLLILAFNGLLLYTKFVP